MAKNRNKKKGRSTEMAIDSTADRPQDESQGAMDTSEIVATSAPVGGTLRRMKKGRPMKRTKNVRKTNAIAKAISESEKKLMKLSKAESKTLRTKFAKTLYD
ncbi:hypothetical protein ACS0TY_018517 [Phlomoides rotata]